MTTTPTPGRPVHAKALLQRIACITALLLATEGAWAAPAAPAATPRGAAADTAGEAPARAYYELHRTEFSTPALVIKPTQTAAALAEGERDPQRARQPRPTGAAPTAK